MHCPTCHSDETCLCSEAWRTGAEGATDPVARADILHEAAPPCSEVRAALTPLCVAVVLNAVALVGTWALQTATHPLGLIGAWWAYEPPVLRWVLLGGLAVSLVWLVAACRALPADRAKRARWARTWICRGCGGTFLPG